MLLVLGNPGAGCTTLLSVHSNHRNTFAEITSDVSFGSITSQEAKHDRGQIIINTEEEIFFPALLVGDNIDFATRLKAPFHLPPDIKNEEEYAQAYKEFLLKSLNITNTKDTKVRDEFICGISGGERKRVSILECLATRGSVFSWDNSTRGLNASTALD
jgi:ABC-type multidrug transport system ATPase subunit